MPPRPTRRHFTQSIAGAALWSALPRRFRGAPPPAARAKSHPYESLFSFIEPGSDEFASEKQAAAITPHLERLSQTRTLPVSSDFQGTSPMPARHRAVAEGFARAEYDPLDNRFEAGLEKWIESLGRIRSAR